MVRRRLLLTPAQGAAFLRGEPGRPDLPFLAALAELPFCSQHCVLLTKYGELFSAWSPVLVP